MALDREYFNSIDLKPVRKKFYPVEDVDALLVDIRKNALAANDELESLKKQLAESEKKRAEMGDALVSSAKNYEEILSNLKKNAGPDLGEVLGSVGETFAAAKKLNQQAIDEIDGRWQKLLSGLMDEEAPSDLKKKVSRIAADMEEISEKPAKKKTTKKASD